MTPWDCIAQRVHPPQCECVPGSVVYGKQGCLYGDPAGEGVGEDELVEIDFACLEQFYDVEAVVVTCNTSSS